VIPRSDRRTARRAVAAAAATVVLAVGAVGCGGSGNGADPPDVNDPNGPPATSPGGAPDFPLPEDQGAQIRAAGLREVPDDVEVVTTYAHVDVLINDHVVPVPAGIGITPSGRSPLHTPSDDGIVAMQTEVPEPGSEDDPPTFTLGQLFTQWGVRLDKSCVATYCTDDRQQLLGLVNGQLVGDPASISFDDGDQIVVWFGPRGTNPPVPATYAFPPSSTR
jgi:hypothetical protein